MRKENKRKAYLAIFTYPTILKGYGLTVLPANNVVMDLETYLINEDNPTPPIICGGYVENCTYVWVHTFRVEGVENRIIDYVSLINFAVLISGIIRRGKGGTHVWVYNKKFEEGYLQKYAETLHIKRNDFELIEAGPTKGGYNHVYKSLNKYANDMNILHRLPIRKHKIEIIDSIPYIESPLSIMMIEDALGRLLDKLWSEWRLPRDPRKLYIPLKGAAIGYLSEIVGEALEGILTHGEEPVTDLLLDVSCLGTIPLCLENFKDNLFTTYLGAKKSKKAKTLRKVSGDHDSFTGSKMLSILTSKPNNLFLILGLIIPDDLNQLICNFDKYIFQVYVETLGRDNNTIHVYERLLEYLEICGFKLSFPVGNTCISYWKKILSTILFGD